MEINNKLACETAKAVGLQVSQYLVVKKVVMAMFEGSIAALDTVAKKYQGELRFANLNDAKLCVLDIVEYLSIESLLNDDRAAIREKVTTDALWDGVCNRYRRGLVRLNTISGNLHKAAKEVSWQARLRHIPIRKGAPKFVERMWRAYYERGNTLLKPLLGTKIQRKKALRKQGEPV